MVDDIIVYSDGAAKGNPGPAGIGVIFCEKNNSILSEISHFIGVKTNNQAEYEALIAALIGAQNFKASNIIFRTDSELVFRQMQGKYKVRDVTLKKYHEIATELLAKLPKGKLEFIPREENCVADRLANWAIKNYLKSTKAME